MFLDLLDVGLIVLYPPLQPFPSQTRHMAGYAVFLDLLDVGLIVLYPPLQLFPSARGPGSQPCLVHPPYTTAVGTRLWVSRRTVKPAFNRLNPIPTTFVALGQFPTRCPIPSPSL